MGLDVGVTHNKDGGELLLTISNVAIILIIIITMLLFFIES